MILNWTKLLSSYFELESFDKRSFNLTQEKDEEGISEKINDFYKEQLHINIDNSSDRIKIDRIITFSEKNIGVQLFPEITTRAW